MPEALVSSVASELAWGARGSSFQINPILGLQILFFPYRPFYETSQALQARLATFLRGTAGWTVAVEQW